MSWKGAGSKFGKMYKLSEYSRLPPSDVPKLLDACIDILEFCIEVTGTVDPAAAPLVASER